MSFTIKLLTLAVLFCFTGLSAQVRVLVDSPQELIVEFTHASLLDSSLKNQMWNCDACFPSRKAGGPHVPYLNLSFLTTKLTPTVSILESQWKTEILSESISIIPTDISNTQQKVIPNPSEFEKSKNLRLELSDISWLRGRPMRILSLNLAKWDGSKSEISVAKYLKIKITFPNTETFSQKPTQTSHQNLRFFQNTVLNPKGGLQMYTVQDPNVLKKTQNTTQAKTSTAALKKSISTRVTTLKIKIGDEEIQTLDHGVFRLKYKDVFDAFKKLGRESEVLNRKYTELHLWTGPQHVLPIAMKTFANDHNQRPVYYQIEDSNGDDRFGLGDALVFYAQGASDWKKNTNVMNNTQYPLEYEWLGDPYSNYNFYFLSIEGSSESATLPQANFVASNQTPITSTYHYVRTEKDVLIGDCDPSNKLDTETGREFYWYLSNPEICGGSSLNAAPLSLPISEVAPPPLKGLISGKPLYFAFQTHSVSSDDIFDVSLGNQQLQYISPGLGDAYYVFSEGVNSETLKFSSLVWNWQRSIPTLGPDQRNQVFKLGFNGFTTIYSQSLSYQTGGNLIFPPKGISGLQNFELSNFSTDQKVLFIKDGLALQILELEGKSNSKGQFSAELSSDEDIRFYIYQNSDVKELKASQFEVLNKPTEGTLNISSSELPSTAKYLIITPSAYASSALKLKDFRSNQSKISRLPTEVVTLEEIYMRYSGGRLSPPALRDFIRYQYFGNATNSQNPGNLEYLLLFGDGYFDYRNVKGNKNLSPYIIPPYQNGEHSTDDYYGYMDSIENTENVVLVNKLDLAIGRIPVKTLEEAENAIKKIKNFENPANFGPWRNRVVLTADDDKQRERYDNIPGGHTNDAEKLGKIVFDRDAGKILEKVYLVEYTANYNYAKPEAAQDLLNVFNRGALSANYFGHGSADVWADEALLVLNRALPKLVNGAKNPMITSFSCTVGRYERTLSDGLSESFVVAKDKGAIATVSASRESYATENVRLALKFYANTFSRDSNFRFKTLGEALLISKVNTNFIHENVNNERYHLLGDPTLKLLMNPLQISLSQYPDTLSLLQCGTIEGTVQGGSGKGYVYVEVRGQSESKTYTSEGNIAAQTVERSGSVLFSGQVAYTGGKFSLNYLLGQKLPFGDTAAEIRIYAWDSEQPAEGTAYRGNLIVTGESNTCSNTDKEGPKILVTGCDRAQSSQVDFPNSVKVPVPYCLEVILKDSTGGISNPIRPDEGVNVEIMGLKAPTKPTLTEDEFARKTYRWDIGADVPPGKYVLKIKAEDGFGNVSEREQAIELVAEDFLSQLQPYNAPNPVKSGGTCFYFGFTTPKGTGEYFVEDAKYSTEIRIYNQRGKLQRILKNVKPNQSSGAESKQECIDRGAWWDIHDDWGNLMANGVYYYDVKVKRTGGDLSSKSSRKKGTLIISR